MVIVADTLYAKFKEMEDKPELIVDEQFMMGMFSFIEEKIPPFKKYNEYLYVTKKSVFISRAGSKVVSFQLLRAELFNPTDEDNKATTPFMQKLGKITAKTFIDEFKDRKKVTWEHLTELKGKRSFGECSTEEKDALVGKRATNDVTESSFLSFTEQLISM